MMSWWSIARAGSWPASADPPVQIRPRSDPARIRRSRPPFSTFLLSFAPIGAQIDTSGSPNPLLTDKSVAHKDRHEHTALFMINKLAAEATRFL